MNDPCLHCRLLKKRNLYLKQQGNLSIVLKDSESRSRTGRSGGAESADSGLLEAVVEATANSVFIWGRDGECLYANRAAVELIGVIEGCQPGVVLRKGFSAISPLVDGWSQQIESVFRDRQVVRSEVAITRNGQGIFLETVFTPLADSEGSTAAVSLVCRDVTERKTLERELAESEEKYRRLYNQSPVCLYRTRIRDGQMLECSKAMADLLGYSSVEECKARCRSTDHYADPDQRNEFMEKLRQENRVHGFEVRIKRTDGRTVWVETTADLYPDEGTIEGAIRDITISKILTESEKEILAHVLNGESNKEIAKRLSRSVRTIEDHRAHIMHKLGAGNVVELTLLAQSLLDREDGKQKKPEK